MLWTDIRLRALSGAHARKLSLPAEIDPSLAAAIKTTPRVFRKYT